MGSEPQKGQYFQSLGATGLTQLNIWVLKPHIRADETLNLSDGGLDECVPKGRSHSALMDLLLMVGINAWKKNPDRPIQHYTEHAILWWY